MRIESIAYVGATEDGELITFGVVDESGLEIDIHIHHSKMSRLLTAILTSGQAAARNRPSTTPMGAPMPELRNLMIVRSAGVDLLPDGNTAVRLMVEDVPMDFRLGPDAAQTILERLRSLQGQIGISGQSSSLN